MKPVHIIGVPLDLGAGRRGVDMGPSAFRIAGIGDQIAALGRTVIDKGDLPAPIPETQRPADRKKKYVRDIAKVCQRLYDIVLKSLDAGALPLMFPGAADITDMEDTPSVSSPTSATSKATMPPWQRR